MAGLIHLPSVEVEETGQITGMAHVHGIGDAVLAGANGLIDPGLHETGELNVLIGGHHEPFHSQAHVHG